MNRMRLECLAIIPIMLLLFSGLLFARDYSKVAPPTTNRVFDGGEPQPNVPYFPSAPDMVTDTIIYIGSTQYDYQSNGSSGHRVAVDNLGGANFGWMNGIIYPTTRQIYYNYVDPSGVWLGETQAGSVNLEGYVQSEVSPDNRAVLVYHRSGPNSVIFAMDSYPGMGIFEYHTVPNAFGAAKLMWPYVTCDNTGRYHIIMTESSATGAPQRMGYTRSSDSGVTWSTLVNVDTVMVIAPVVVSSPVSNKVAIVYSHPTDSTTQWKNNIYYIQSADGTTWNWATDKTNITRYGGRDSLWAYTDLAAIYDYNDDLHIVWNAQWVTDAGIYYKTFLNHYDIASGNITEMQGYPDSLWPSSGCDYGAWNRPICKMSIGVHANNELFVAYTKFDTSDCSAGGFANGDIYLMYSSDHGRSWPEEINITNTHTPGCQPGDCDSEHWSTIAGKVDSNIYLTYIQDRDAGGIPQTEGTITDNPVLSHKFGNPTLTGIDDIVNPPKSISLKQNYPNPFNAQTNIDFTLQKNSRVELAVYNLLGAKVATLVNGQMESGSHSVNFDASKITSGVYYYTLKTDGSAVSKKMTLLK